jgi:predicted site-specific integrase-resolvase
MHSQSSTLDPELARLARPVPLCGRPKAKPLVEGAFIITRLSKREEKMSSLSMQERHACRYVEEALGIPVLGVFPDIRSGLQAERRAGYQEAMRRVRLGLCSHIVVYDFDRFSRERVTSLHAYEDLERLGIELHDTLTGHIAHDVAGEKAVAAESEARKIRAPRRPPRCQY